jgi:hypothetical protein
MKQSPADRFSGGATTSVLRRKSFYAELKADRYCLLYGACMPVVRRIVACG